MEHPHSSNEPLARISRRSTLAKGTAAGVLAWTTPVVLSAPASAATCSPSCRPPGVPSAGTISGVWTSTAITFTVSVPAFTCECEYNNSSTAAVLLSGSLTRTRAAGASQNCNSTLVIETLTGVQSGNTLTFTRTNTATRFCYGGTITVAVTCFDRLGRPITSQVTITVPRFAVQTATGTALTSTAVTFGNFETCTTA